MLLRHAATVPLRLLANILLARQLAPTDFGTYAIATFVVSTATLFTDFGLTAALIQKRDAPTPAALRTTFTVRFALALGLVLLLHGASAPLAALFRMSETSRQVIPWLALVLPVGAIGSISLALLERALAYPRLARIEVAAVFIFHLTAVALAYGGFGVWSFVGAAVASESARAVFLLAAARWPLGFAVDGSVLRAALRFGAPFQLGTWTSLLRDHLASLLAGPLFGPRAVGYLNWAHGVAYHVSQAVTEALGRVSFPSLSRAQGDRETFSRILEKLLRALLLLTTPLLAVTTGLIPWIVTFLYTEKWAPAIPAFYGFAVRMLGGTVTTPLVAALNAWGRPREALKILVLWTASDWAAALLLTAKYGFAGVAMAYGVSVWLPVIGLIRALAPIASVNWAYALVRPALAGAMTVVLLRALAEGAVSGLASLLALAVLGLLAYAVFLLLLERRALLVEMRTGAHAILRAMRGTSYVESERLR
jgi:O-antigen/teichoic acid export membrane protein